VSIDDELFTTHAPWLVRMLVRRGGEIEARELWLLRRVAQAMAEQRNREARQSSLRQDRRFAQVLAFAGRGE
jgi:hypothetical protein